MRYGKIEWEMRNHNFFLFSIAKIIINLYDINRGNKGERILKYSKGT